MEEQKKLISSQLVYVLQSLTNVSEPDKYNFGSLGSIGSIGLFFDLSFKSKTKKCKNV